MTRAALGLLALAGCNSWFGLDPTTEVVPDAIDAAPPTTTVNVVYRDGLTADDLGSFIDVPIADAMIRANGVTAPYDGGNATIPLSITTTPWRLEIAAPGQTTVELQWMPTNARVCLPRWGRLDRPPLSGDDNHIFMDVTTSGLHKPSVLTSGVWTQRELSSANANVDLFWSPTIVTPMDGPLAPIGEPGDWMALVDYTTLSGDPDAREAIAFARVPAQLNVHVPVNLIKTPMFDTPYAQLSDTFALNLFAQAQVPNSGIYSAAVGLTASAEMANQPLDGGPAKMWTLGKYGKTPPTSMFNVIRTDFKLPHVMQLRRISRTTYNGVNLDSSIERIDIGSTSAYATGTSNSVPVAIATATTVNDTATSGVASVIESGAIGDTKVAWTPSPGQVDIAVVTMYEVLQTSLAPVKQYVTSGTSVVVEKELLKAGHDYVFEITLRAGFPNASAGDLCTVTYPMSDTQLFTAVVNVR